jgi:radical SAM superfamily enzyme YgiQ (UPF0313 family)
MARPLVVLVGAEIEENLSIRYLAAVLEAGGFTGMIIRFNESMESDAVVRDICAAGPLVVGISIPFQARARELLGLASHLRLAGYRGHISVGGHFATFEYAGILQDYWAVDSVVRHEGEHTFAEVCKAVRDGIAVGGIPGTIARDNGEVTVAPKRALGPLDDLPFPQRPATPNIVLGISCAPIMASRGCYANCTFCCIHAYTDNAAGPRYRKRSPENIVREMLQEYRERGVRLFVFHDDNFLVPSVAKNLQRCSELAALLARQELDGIGLVMKCRPQEVDRQLFESLQSMGVIRVYVGIETNSDEGVVSLNRGISPSQNRRSLEILRGLGIYCSFNVLIFDPEATLRGIQQNLEFMEQFADVPFNFCRAEVYAGTPLKQMLTAQGRLLGDYLAWGYEMRDPRVELLFRIVSTAFAQRNFKPDGLANLNMGIRFDNEVLSHFHSRARDRIRDEQLVALSREIGLDSVAHFRRALQFVAETDQPESDAVKRFTVQLAGSLARSELRFLPRIKSARREMESCVPREHAGLSGAL